MSEFVCVSVYDSIGGTISVVLVLALMFVLVLVH